MLEGELPVLPPFRTFGDPIRATSGRLETDVPARSQKSISLRFGIGETCMSEAVGVDSEKRLNRDVALPSHRDRISDGMAMARIRET
jgi:hypothetical protein